METVHSTMEPGAVFEDTVPPAFAEQPKRMAGQDDVLFDGGSVSDAAAAAPYVPARLVEYAPGCHIALPLHVALEVLEPAHIVQVPGSLPGWCGLLRWRGHWVPVIDPAAVIAASASTSASASPSPSPSAIASAITSDGRAGHHLLVLGWRPAPGEPFRYGAITLNTMPVTVKISDDMQCSLPADIGFWRSVALSCVSHEGHAVPIVDAARLFSFRASVRESVFDRRA